MCDKVEGINQKITEKIHDSPVNWAQTYSMITSMNKMDIDHYQQQILANHPNTYTFSKRMAEHLLCENNTKKIPLYILRPTIIGASLEEPFPGWTDSIGFAGGIYLLAGLGILRELPGNKSNIGD